MKILIVSTIPTHPTNAGNRKWILSQAELLKDLGHEVHFLYIYERALRKVNDDSISLSQTTEYWGKHFHCYQVPIWEKLRLSLTDYIRKSFFNWYWKCDDAYPRGLHKVINRINAEIGFEAVIINYYYLSKCFKHIRIPLKAISTHDCFSFRDLSIKARGVYTTTPNEEAKALQRCPHIFALQDEEQIFFQKLSPNRRNSDLRHLQPLKDNYLCDSDLFGISHSFAEWAKSKDMQISERERFPTRNPG